MSALKLNRSTDTMASAGELEMDYVKSIPFSTDILYTNFKRKSVESQTGNFATWHISLISYSRKRERSSSSIEPPGGCLLYTANWLLGYKHRKLMYMYVPSISSKSLVCCFWKTALLPAWVAQFLGRHVPDPLEISVPRPISCPNPLAGPKFTIWISLFTRGPIFKKS